MIYTPFVNETKASSKAALSIFRRKGGVLHTTDAIRGGIHPRTLYKLRDENQVVQISRGVYRLADLPEITNPDLVAVATRIPDSVVCLISALSFHEITTEVPHEVYVALARGSKPPRLDYPPLRVFTFSSDSFSTGIEIHNLDGIPVRIFDPEKTVADCFKFRHKIGIDVALEALKLCRARKRFQLRKLITYARLCRVERIMRPYLEALS
jgi:predicted transcriptional regulator of viral defense system